jgi:hypothetical protein
LYIFIVTIKKIEMKGGGSTSTKRVSAATANFPIEISAMRQMCRGGIALKHERVHWWPVFSMPHKDNIVTSYPDVVEKVKESLTAATEPGKRIPKLKTMEGTFRVLKKKFDILEPEFLEPLFKLVSAEFDTTKDGPVLVYFIFDNILSDNTRFTDFTTDGIRGNHHAFRKILEKNNPKTFKILNDIGALQDEYLNLMWVEYFKPLFARLYTASIMDSFMLDGTSSLLRYGIGLVCAYKKSIKANKYATGAAFWEAVKQQNDKDIFVAMQDFAFDTKVTGPLRLLSFKYDLTNKQISDLASRVRSDPPEAVRRATLTGHRLSINDSDNPVHAISQPSMSSSDFPDSEIKSDFDSKVNFADDVGENEDSLSVTSITPAESPEKNEEDVDNKPEVRSDDKVVVKPEEEEEEESKHEDHHIESEKDTEHFVGSKATKSVEVADLRCCLRFRPAN